MTVRFAHTNLVARDWKKLAAFYQTVFDCEPVPPERDLSGAWLDAALNLDEARIQGMHLRLPGHGPDGPTLEIFQYNTMPDHPDIRANTPGFSHIAFAVDDVRMTSERILEHGGSPVGECTKREIPGAGTIVFQYLRDPEGNIIEIQSWD